MERIINIKVSGNHLTKDGKNAGTRGEANATILRITFDEGWDGYAKSVVFLDAHGMNPTRFTLTTNLLENAAESTRIYLVPIPPASLAVAGEMSLSIEGYIDGKRQRSVKAMLEVEDGIITDVIDDVTPTQAEQLQAQYESIMNDIQQAAISRNEAKTSAENAEQSAINAEKSAQSAEQTKGEVETLKRETLTEVDTNKNAALTEIAGVKDGAISEIDINKQQALTEMGEYKDEALRFKQDAEASAQRAENNFNQAKTEADNAAGYATQAENAATRAKSSADSSVLSAEQAEDCANRAENAIGKTNYIGDNGNWFAWDSEKDAFYDTGVKGQSGSTVYLGDNPPADADVWIDTDGGSVEIVPMPDDSKINSHYALPSMATMNHYINKALSSFEGGNTEPSQNIDTEKFLQVLDENTVFEDLEWASDKETKICILKKGTYYFGSDCEFEAKEDGIAFITRNALEYYETNYFLTFICETGIKFFDFITPDDSGIYDTDSPNREFSFANVDSILTFGSISESYTTLECIHLMSPSGTAYRITVNDDGVLEATSHDEM